MSSHMRCAFAPDKNLWVLLLLKLDSDKYSQLHSLFLKAKNSKLRLRSSAVKRASPTPQSPWGGMLKALEKYCAWERTSTPINHSSFNMKHKPHLSLNLSKSKVQFRESSVSYSKFTCKKKKKINPTAWFLDMTSQSFKNICVNSSINTSRRTFQAFSVKPVFLVHMRHDSEHASI